MGHLVHAPHELCSALPYNQATDQGNLAPLEQHPEFVPQGFPLLV